MSAARILIVDDEDSIREVLQDILEDEGHQVVTAENAAAARSVFEASRFNLILLDIWMPDVDGISLLKEWQANGNQSPVVMISGHGTVETAVEAIQLGAYDFLEKPLSTAKLLITVNRALRANAQHNEIKQLRKQVAPSVSLVGQSDKIKQARDQIDRVGKTQSWVMVTGQPGSGKGIVARAIHQASNRQDKRFVEVSLAAIPAENIARRLFGSEGAESIHAGCFEQAHGGTLFLDEIADLDWETQTQLLSALQAGRYLRVGGHETIDMDVRIISSTNQALGKRVADGVFREDLYYRLNVVPLEVCPLMDRLDDIPLLIEYFVDRLVHKDKLPYRRVDTGGINRLRQHSWPGNVRELENLVQRLLITGGTENVDGAEIERLLMGSNQSNDAAPAEEMSAQYLNTDLRTARDNFERTYFEYHLEAVNGNVTALAEVTGLERTHLYRKMKSLTISPKDWK